MRSTTRGTANSRRPPTTGAAAASGEAATTAEAAVTATAAEATRDDNHGRVAKAAPAEARAIRATGEPATALKRTQEQQNGNKGKDTKHRPGHVRGYRGRPLPRPARRRNLSFRPQQLEHAARSGFDATLQVSGAEARQDQRLHDGACGRVGQHAFKPMADLDPHLALVRRHQEERAVVLLRPAKAPVAEQPVRELLEAKALQRADGRDHDLVTGCLLVRREVARKTHLRL